MGYPPTSNSSRGVHPSSTHMVDPQAQAVAAQFYQSQGVAGMGQAPPSVVHPGHTVSQASSLVRLQQMTHSLDIPGLPGVQTVPGHPVPVPQVAVTTSSKSSPSPSTAPRQSKSKSRPTSSSVVSPQAPPPAGHPALQIPPGYMGHYPGAHHGAPPAQVRGGQAQIAPRPPNVTINPLMQQYAHSLQAQQYNAYNAMLQNPALVNQMYGPQYDPQRSGGQMYPGYGAIYGSNIYR